MRERERGEGWKLIREVKQQLKEMKRKKEESNVGGKREQTKEQRRILGGDLESWRKLRLETGEERQLPGSIYAERHAEEDSQPYRNTGPREGIKTLKRWRERWSVVEEAGGCK